LRCYAGRFAPSPTGPLHFGSLIAALASYADAKASAGSWHLRIEDLDPPREQPGAAAQILATLEDFGFEWDGDDVYQSAREERYRGALQRLFDEGRLYACGCTRSELAAGALGVGGERVYPGTCRDGMRAGRVQRASRVRVDDATIAFSDRVQGAQSQALAQDVGDFIVRRADGLWAYQLAVVVDDAEAGITDIVRGADLLASTPRQIWLQRLLGYATPRYAHVPIAVDARGEKLSKQTHAPALDARDAIPALMRAWRLLEQARWDERLVQAREFWRWAIAHWDASRIPPVPTLPPVRAADPEVG
jgi:glutamyl-Q tRNA(Asp) synthetase